MFNLPPEVLYAIVTGAATLALTALHARGVKLPIIENILAAILGAPKPAPVPSGPVDPTKPATPAPAHPFLSLILSALASALAGRTVAGYNVTPTDSGVTVKVDFLPKS